MRTPLVVIIMLGMAIIWSCDKQDVQKPPSTVNKSLINLLDDNNAPNIWDNPGVCAPDQGCEQLQLKWIGRLKSEFNDSNHIHLEAARLLGIRPITSSGDILTLNRPLVKIASCQEYYVGPLTHSHPYLVPEAAELLNEIGRRFNTALVERGGGAYRIKVTSLLRTQSTVKHLTRVNRNATGHSAHFYGTTFDISYSKFICDDSTSTRRTFEDLKNLLGEILHNLRLEDRCYIKYESKQSCFHITTRPL